MTTDFNSWEDVEQYLKDGGQVYVSETWIFNQHYMSCGNYDEEYGYCCEGDFKDASEAVVDIRDWTCGDLMLVEKLEG